ncbi:hypothetical protein AV521_35245 [Streptomyces sp. IMTB 2501]|nr:hypothetical protein AV521_35245 [Streptomyces sp. IMTB 2501]
MICAGRVWWAGAVRGRPAGEGRTARAGSVPKTVQDRFVMALFMVFTGGVDQSSRDSGIVRGVGLGDGS